MYIRMYYVYYYINSLSGDVGAAVSCMVAIEFDPLSPDSLQFLFMNLFRGCFYYVNYFWLKKHLH